jgi:hypothetical protein
MLFIIQAFEASKDAVRPKTVAKPTNVLKHLKLFKSVLFSIWRTAWWE